MSGIKIGPPGGPPRVPPGGGERGDRKVSSAGGRSFAEAASGPERSEAGAEPAELVRLVRSGQMDVDRAVDLLVARALDGKLLSATPEALRQEVREAISELAREDPALAALVQAMKR